MFLNARKDWAEYDPSKIPTKSHMPHVEHWISTLSLPATVLDVGCGNGSVTKLLIERGYPVVGIDINGAAIEGLTQEFRGHENAVFYQRDVASALGFELGGTLFDGVVCQLVMSIIGDMPDRIQLLKNIHAALVPAGKLIISFSGLSNDINPAYGGLYRTDLPITGEYGTYHSRDESGRILYQTHHFSAEEIQQLLKDQGFCGIGIEESIETSSRRPEEQARFYYVNCKRDDS